MTEEQKKIKALEDKIKILENVVSKIAARVEYHDRERQRMKSDINTIAGALRK
jgi:hypothetical protein